MEYTANGIYDESVRYKNPHASMELVHGIRWVPTVPHETVMENIRANSLRELPWVKVEEPNSKAAVIVANGPSLLENLEVVDAIKRTGGVIYACNSAARVLRDAGIHVDWQVIMDPIPSVVDELCHEVDGHLLSSMCDPEVFNRSHRAVLWHPAIHDIENHIPASRGEFAGIGGGITVLNSTLCLSHTLGHRSIVVFGADSSFQEDKHYASGELIPDADRLRIVVKEGGKEYRTTGDLRRQVVVFMELAKLMTDCDIHVRGSGLLPDVFNAQLLEEMKCSQVM